METLDTREVENRRHIHCLVGGTLVLTLKLAAADVESGLRNRFGPTIQGIV